MPSSIAVRTFAQQPAGDDTPNRGKSKRRIICNATYLHAPSGASRQHRGQLKAAAWGPAASESPGEWAMSENKDLLCSWPEVKSRRGNRVDVANAAKQSRWSSGPELPTFSSPAARGKGADKLLIASDTTDSEVKYRAMRAIRKCTQAWNHDDCAQNLTDSSSLS